MNRISRLLSNSPRTGYILLIILLLSLYTQAFCDTIKNGRKRVLLIASYSSNFPSFNMQMNGLQSVFGQENVSADVEFMDSRRLPSKESIQDFSHYLAAKLRNLPDYDLIMTSDDIAFNYVLENKKLFPKNVPIVFFGVNDAELAHKQDSNSRITGVIERISPLKTANLMKSLQPSLEKITLIADGTTSARLDLNTICSSGILKEKECRVLSLEKLSWAELQDSLKTLDQETNSVLLVSAYIDKNKQPLDFSNSLNLIREASSAPIYHLWEQGIGNGVVGGCVVSHYEQARQAALMAGRLLKNGTLQIPVMDTESNNKYMLDFKELKRAGLQAKRIPTNSIVVNRPINIWRKYGLFFVIAIVTVVFELLLIINLFFALNQRKKYLLESKGNEEKLRITLQSIGDAVIATDTKGHITRMNGIAEKLTGWSSKDALGRNIKEVFRIVDEKSGEKIDDPVYKVLELKGVVGPTNNTKLLSKDNKEYIISDRAAPIINDDNHIEGVVMVFQDVTSRKKQEQIIRESEEQLNMFFNQSISGFFLMKLDRPIDIRNKDFSKLLPEIMKSLKITKVNQALAELYGLQDTEMIGSNILGINASLHDRLSILEQVIANGSYKTITVEKNREGKDIWVNGQYTAIFEEDGVLSGLFGTQYNVTEKYLKEREIANLVELQQGILDNLVSSAVVKDIDDDFRILHWNKYIAEYSGISAEQAIGKTDFDLFPEDIAKEIRRTDLSTMASPGKKISYEKKIDGVSSRNRYFKTVKTIIPKEGSSGLLLSFSFDIDDLKIAQADLIIAKEKAETADRLKSSFLANMSHEIRTPLNSIVGFSYLLAVSDDEKESVEFYEIIKSNTDLLLTLINDIVDYSKIESGLLNLVHETCDVAKCLEKAANTVRPKIAESIEFKLILPETEPLYILTDVQRILQVLLNLLTNAMKHTEKGHIYLGYKLQKDEIIFYVEDTGSGIEEADKEKIFERFFKKDPFKQGTGLGLSICKLLVEAFEGRIWLESEIGKGSIFYFSIPCHKTEKPNETMIDYSELARISVSPDQMKTLLIAEDTMSNYLLMKTILSKSYKLLHARTGKQAVALFMEHNPDAVLMDIKMPEMDGFEAARQIREVSVDVPIIAVTAYAYDSDKILALESGCNDYVSKPIDVRILRNMLEKYIYRV